jgi:hypothetical protein
MSLPTNISIGNNMPGVEIDFNRTPDRTDQLNARLNSRNNVSNALKPNFDPRPVSTKYALFPIIDRRVDSLIEKKKYNVFSPETSFNPSSDRAPVDGFLNNVAIETELRGQNNIMKGGDLGNKYMPDFKGSLYNVHVGNILEAPDPKHHLLFERGTFSQATHENIHPRIGGDTFHNNTRVQLRDT